MVHLYRVKKTAPTNTRRIKAMKTKLTITDIEYYLTEEDITITEGMDEEAIEEAIEDLRKSLPKTIEIEVDEKDAICLADIVTKRTGFVVTDYDTITYLNGFDEDDFLWYMSHNYSKHDPYGDDLTENLVEYALEHEHVSKDQLCYFLADILPEIEFAEVAQFCDDSILTEWGKSEKRRGLKEYGGREFWKYDK